MNFAERFKALMLAVLASGVDLQQLAVRLNELFSKTRDLLGEFGDVVPLLKKIVERLGDTFASAATDDTPSDAALWQAIANDSEIQDAAFACTAFGVADTGYGRDGRLIREVFDLVKKLPKVIIDNPELLKLLLKLI